MAAPLASATVPPGPPFIEPYIEPYLEPYLATGRAAPW